MSSASTYALSKHSNNANYGSLPSYGEAVQMKEFSTAPLQEETSSQGIFGTATSLNLEFDSGDSANYSFLIRDKDGRLQAKGYVSNFDITLKNINGLEMMKIIKKDSVNYETAAHVHMFEIRHNNDEIGAIKVVEAAPSESCLQIYHRGNNPQVIVRSLKYGDFAIFRDLSSSTPLCNIQLLNIENIESYTFGEFNGTIIFEPETEVTTQEQLLCTAAGIAFKVVTKQVTKKVQERRKLYHRFATFCCGLIFVGFMLLIWIFVKLVCEEKKYRGSKKQC